MKVVFDSASKKISVRIILTYGGKEYIAHLTLRDSQMRYKYPYCVTSLSIETKRARYNSKINDLKSHLLLFLNSLFLDCLTFDDVIRVIYKHINSDGV